ncbi:hypothetical protein [Anabaena sp. UHCC 0399]|uniref:hypothetical protein n=1 Tax=Anabaena sp. UHCC 0399 TaxID=3110238 RepID=UPI002B21609E|nr:hypothetical protein [Anabaena sp. UHCC 0399]MEA5566672.1 hypothetical protein [Anabaena sp. UHCC 0399]
MPRLKRWLNMYKKKVNQNGDLHEEYIQELRSDGFDEDYIVEYALKFKKEYEQLQDLDATDPEPWPVYTAYDFFTDEEKRQFNPDGSLKPEYRESELARGTSENWLDEMERRKKLDVDNYNAVSARYAQQGINFGEQEMNRLLASKRTYLERRKQMEIDLRNCEEPSSLPFDKDTSF